MEQTGPAPACAPIVHHRTASNSDTSPPSSLNATMALVRDVILDTSGVVPSDFGVSQSEIHCDESQRYVGDQIPADTPDPKRHLSFQTEVSDICPNSLGDVPFSRSPPCSIGNDIDWSPILPSSSPSVLPSGDLPLHLLDPSVSSKSPLLVQSFGAEMSISPGSNMAENCQVGDDTPPGAQLTTFHPEMPNAEAFWGQSWFEEHQKSLKNAFLGIPTQNMEIPLLSVPKVIFDPPPRGPKYRCFPKCANGGPGTPPGPQNCH